MHKLPIAVMGASFALIFAACSKQESEAVSESQPAEVEAPVAESTGVTEAEQAGGGDPTVVDPEHYTTEFENEAVRIVRIAYGPGEESIMHYHPDSVAVFLTDHLVQMTMPDGSTEEISASAGEALFIPGGQHLPKNISDLEWELALVEFKKSDSAAGESGGPDPIVVDADHYAAEFENDAVRIVRIAYEPGEESVMHYHPDSVAVFLTDHRVQMTMPDGSTDEISANAGDALFIPGGQPLPKNISDSAWELALVELK